MIKRYNKNIEVELKPSNIITDYDIIKQKLPENTECNIIGDVIENNGYYWECDRCTCVCDYELFILYLSLCSKKCPCCQLVLHP